MEATDVIGIIFMAYAGICFGIAQGAKSVKALLVAMLLFTVSVGFIFYS